MKVAFYGIIGRQFLGAKNATLGCYDLDMGREFTVTFQGGRIADEDMAIKTPRNYVLDGVEFRTGDKGQYMTCTNVVNTDPPAARAPRNTASS